MNLVIISVADDQLFSGHLEITPVQGTAYDITMAAAKDDALGALLTSMP
ncbi:MAG: hypothetical protein ACI84C_000202 [Flavobacteriales bacterium]|jgi:hypothetical protein